MRGVRRRSKAAADNRTSQAWQTGAFTGATQSKGGLKPLAQYLQQAPRKMSNKEMLGNMRRLVARANRASRKSK